MSASFDPPASATAEQLFEIGLRAARDASGLRDIERLFDSHFDNFGYDRERYKRLTLQLLRAKASRPFALHCLMRASSADLTNQRYLHEQALLFEEMGQFKDALRIRERIRPDAPEWIENHAGICRLREKSTAASGESAEKYYARGARNVAYYLLTLSRLAALKGPKALKDMTIERLEGRAHEAMAAAPNSVALNLAMGFINLATENEKAAQRYFLAASMLRDQPRVAEDHYDRSSMDYAQAFVLKRGPIDEPGFFNEVDRVNLTLARGALLRQQGAAFSALSEYDAAISLLAPARDPSSIEIYKGYKIVLNAERYYAIPRSVFNFTIVRGVVIRAPQIVGDTTPRFRDRLAERLGPQGRATVKRLLSKGLAVARHVPGSRWVGRKILHWYVDRYAVEGVLVDTDILMLEQRIDTVAPAGGPEPTPQVKAATV